MNVTTRAAMKDQITGTHGRWATVQGGELDGWIVVAYGTDEEFRAGIVGGHRIVDVDEHCVHDCPGKH